MPSTATLELDPSVHKHTPFLFRGQTARHEAQPSLAPSRRAMRRAGRRV